MSLWCEFMWLELLFEEKPCLGNLDVKEQDDFWGKGAVLFVYVGEVPILIFYFLLAAVSKEFRVFQSLYFFFVNWEGFCSLRLYIFHLLCSCMAAVEDWLFTVLITGPFFFLCILWFIYEVLLVFYQNMFILSMYLDTAI